MWFDPDREVPSLSQLPSDSDGAEGFYEGGALEGTPMEEGSSTHSGGDAKTSDLIDSDLPF